MDNSKNNSDSSKKLEELYQDFKRELDQIMDDFYSKLSKIDKKIEDSQIKNIRKKLK